MNGIPMPYLLRYDWMVTIVLFFCLLLVCYVFSKGRKHLVVQLKNFLISRERSSIFDGATAADFHYTFMLLFHSGLMLGFCFYDYFSKTNSSLFSQYSHISLLLFFVILSQLFIFLKGLLYQWVNWVFFSSSKAENWMSAYINVTIWFGLLLLPVVLMTIYCSLSMEFIMLLVVFMLLITKMMLFYKGFCNFFPNFYGTLHLILYFCTLEILPDLIVWKGIHLISEYFTLNF